MAKMVIYSGSKLVHIFDLIDLETGKKVGDSFIAEDVVREGSLEEYAVIQQRWNNTWQQLKAQNEGAGQAPPAPPAAPPEPPAAPPEPPAPNGEPAPGQGEPQKRKK